MASTQTIKVGRTVFDTARESLDRLAGKAGTPEPTSPAAAATVGANPDQAKMAGTGDQRAAVVRRATQPAQTLSAQQRQVSAGAEATNPANPAAQVAQQAAAKADQLRTLGSLGSRVQSLLEQQLAAPAAAQPAAQVDRTAVAAALGLRPDDAKVQDAVDRLAAYAGSKSEADLANAATALGLQQLTSQGVGRFLRSGADVLSEQTAAATQNAATAGDVGLASAEAASALGLDQAALAAMSLKDLNERLDAVRQSELNRVAALRAELASAPPARAAAIQAELKSLTQAGLGGVESGAKRLANSVAEGRRVQFAGREYDIEQLLADETISDVVRLAATNPAALKQLQADAPQLAEWIGQHLDDLKALGTESTYQARELAATQSEYAALTKDIGPELAAKLLPGREGKVLTTAELAQARTDLEASPAYQAMLADPALRAKFQANPALLDQVAGMTAEQIKTGAAAAQELATDGFLAAVAGLPGDATILTADQQAALQAAKNSGIIKAAAGDSKLTTYLLANPQALEQLKGLDEASVRAAIEAGRQLGLDPVLQGLSGITAPVLLPEQRAQLDTLRASPDYKRLMGNPALRQQLNGLPATFVAEVAKLPQADRVGALEAAAYAGANAGLAKLMGIQSATDVLKAPKYKDWVAAWKTLPPGADAEGALSSMINSGALDTLDELKLIAKKPELLEQAAGVTKTLKSFQDKLTAAGSDPRAQHDAWMEYMFGTETDTTQVVDSYLALKQLLKQTPYTAPEYHDIQRAIGALEQGAGLATAADGTVVIDFAGAARKLQAAARETPQQLYDKLFVGKTPYERVANAGLAGKALDSIAQAVKAGWGSRSADAARGFLASLAGRPLVDKGTADAQAVVDQRAADEAAAAKAAENDRRTSVYQQVKNFVDAGFMSPGRDPSRLRDLIAANPWVLDQLPNNVKTWYQSHK